MSGKVYRTKQGFNTHVEESNYWSMRNGRNEKVICYRIRTEMMLSLQIYPTFDAAQAVLDKRAARYGWEEVSHD